MRQFSTIEAYGYKARVEITLDEKGNLDVTVGSGDHPEKLHAAWVQLTKE